MALILNVETATTSCSVAVGKDGNLLDFKELNDGYTHAENLNLFIIELLRKHHLTLQQFDAFAVSMGPGSYTGLRIGVSTAKGLCYGTGKPLIAVNTLEAMASGVVMDENTLLCPMIDARRMEVYSAVYDNKGKEIKPTAAVIIDVNSFDDLLDRNRIVFFGDGAEKCKYILSVHSNAVFLDNKFPSARDMVKLSESKFKSSSFENTAYFEPFYLKDFVAGGKAGL